MNKLFQLVVWLIILLMFSVSCALGSGNGHNATGENFAGVVEDDTISVEDTQPLPHKLYYLALDEVDNYQVWHLERDGITQVQVTFELTKVKEYTVSPIDGRVAYIVENQVYIINPDGSGRQALRAA